MAALRRDGFASVRPADGGRAAKMMTVTFGMEHRSLLFVNAACESDGNLRAAVLPSMFDAPIAVGVLNGPLNKTKVLVPLQRDALPRHAGSQAVRIEFTLTRCELFAFWLSGHADGRSGGYVGSGGPSYPSLYDKA